MKFTFSILPCPGMQGLMIASDLVTVPWPNLFSGVFGVSRCICLVHYIHKWCIWCKSLYLFGA